FDEQCDQKPPTYLHANHVQKYVRGANHFLRVTAGRRPFWLVSDGANGAGATIFGSRITSSSGREMGSGGQNGPATKPTSKGCGRSSLGDRGRRRWRPL